MNKYIFSENGNRIRSPQETLDCALKLLSKFSHTSFLKVDSPLKVSTPVYRYDKDTFSSYGKGLTDIQAQTSCAMESLEYLFSDHAFASIINGSFHSLKDQFLMTDPNLYLNPYYEIPDLHKREFEWIYLTSLKNSDQILFPAAFTIFPYHDVQFFPCSTNGLASGNTLEEALIHGLYELIERHMMTQCRHGMGLKTIIERDLYPQEIKEALSDEYSVEAYFLESFSEEKIPVIEFQITYQGETFPGHGCDFNYKNAFTRAFTEAIQVLNLNINRNVIDPLPKNKSHRLQEKSLPGNKEKITKDDLSSVIHSFSSSFSETTQELKQIKDYLTRNNHHDFFYRELHNNGELFFVKIISLSLLQPKRFFPAFFNR